MSRWTQTPPTAEGYYWVRHPGQSSLLRVGEVMRLGSGPSQTWLYGIDGDSIRANDLKNTWWCGPIPSPPAFSPENKT